MGSRLKRLFFGKSSSSSASSGNPNLKGKSYDSTVALDPPVKGSYPVAGNGPNVLDELQRLRSKRDASRPQSTISTRGAAPTIPRFPEDIIERPRTAPHNGGPGGGYSSVSNISHERTRSGFSMKSPPNFLSSNKRNSIRSIVEPPPPLVPTPVSKPSATKPREIKAYRPKKITEPAEPDIPDTITPPFALHHRNASQVSHKSHVDLLDAHSNIRPSRDVSRDRAKASGVRNYGEDVADRNIAAFDLNSPEFSYLKSVYVSQKGAVAGPKERGSHARAISARGSVLGQEQTPSDDIHPPQNQMKANSTHSAHNNAPRTGVVHPPRIDSTSAVSYSANRRRDDAWLANSNPVHEYRVRTLSPFSTTPDSIDEEPERQLFVPPTSAPPIPARGRARTLTKEHNPPPLAFTRTAAPVQSQSKPLTNAPSLKSRRRAMSEASQSSVTSGGTYSRSGSMSYSSLPSSSRQDFQTDNQSATRGQSYGTASKKPAMIVEGAKEPPSLEGVVDLSNTMDTDVTTKSLPAVTHEKVLPTRHEIREERITRETHTHDVFHRILPVIETEILPPKHYVLSSDGKGLVEIPEHMVRGRTANGSPSRNWEIVQTGLGRGDHGAALHRKIPSNHSRKRSQSLTQSSYRYLYSNIDEEDGADGPVIGYTRPTHTRGDSFISTHTRGNSRASTHTSKGSMTKNTLEPILSSKKEYITKEGYPKTEYVWRHPPVFETTTGQTQPIYMGAGLRDLSSPRPKTAPAEPYHSEEEEIEGADFGVMRTPNMGEEGLLFRDSGYGSHGMLPGLTEKTPLAGLSGQSRFVPEDFEVVRLGKVVGDEEAEQRKSSEGEATRALRRIRENRRSSGGVSVASTIEAHGKGASIDDVERGMNGLNI